jgi:CheY-like chemotaxis protein
LLLDLQMPCKSGLETLRWLRRTVEFQHLPVAILTSFSGPSEVREAAELGVKGYLVKPIGIAEWVLKVQTLTSQCKS